MDFKDANPGALILLGDDRARETAAALRQLLPDWTCELVDDCSRLAEAGGLKICLGIAIAPQKVDNRTLAWLERATRVGANLLWIAVIGKHHHGHPEFMKAVAASYHDFFTTPVAEAADMLRSVLAHAAGLAWLRAQLLDTPATADSIGPDLLGGCPAMKRLGKFIAKFARVDAPVMIRGESGTGKELVAQAVHRASARAGRPFIAVNCGAIPENLVESELFGHVKGAFTGALQDRLGRAALADRGTLFLDEIGDLPLSHQVKILRFVQEGAFAPVGSSCSIRADVRIIAATHVDLAAAVKAQTFREDLFYRLNVLQVEVPPLRDRGDDIDLLARHFLSSIQQKTPTLAKGFSANALLALRRYPWPGNVRELINRVSKAAVMAEGALITPEDLDLPDPWEEEDVSIINLQGARERAERTAIELALQDSNFNLSQAANQLGVSRMTIYRLLEKHGIRIP
jgi:DNA-binding NtrC family response regulator